MWAIPLLSTAGLWRRIRIRATFPPSTWCGSSIPHPDRMHPEDICETLIKATSRKCVCGSQRIFCTGSAVPKMGNTYSISAFWNYESAQNLSLSFLADLWGTALNPRARFCAFRFMKALAAHRVFFASAAVALPGAGCRHMGERAALAENPPGLGDGPCLRSFLSMTRRFPPYSDNEKDSKDGSQTDYFHGHRGHHY